MDTGRAASAGMLAAMVAVAALTLGGHAAQAGSDAQYIAGMKKNHPDQVSTMSGKIQEYFPERAKRINNAYDMLKNNGG